MAKLRKFSAYRRLERPYTRRSKYRSKSYVRSGPNNRVVRYHMGDPKGDFETSLMLVADQDLQIRDNAIESARQATLRKLERNLGKTGFHFQVRIYPHHILRENPLASGAGADRMSTGMKMSFGKAIGVAAQVKKNQIIFQIDCPKKHVDACKKWLKVAASKLPCHCRVIVQ